MGGATLLMGGLALEGRQCWESGGVGVILQSPFRFGMSAIMGLLIQLLTPAVVKATSSVALLSHCVSANWEGGDV